MKKKESSDEIYELSLNKLLNNAPSELPAANVTAAASPLMSEEKLDSLLRLTGENDASGAELYAYYRDLYKDAAASAAQNAFGLAAAHSGGYASTYAVSEAREAYESYMKDLNGAYEQAKAQREKTVASSLETIISLADKAAKYGDYSYYEALGADMSDAERADAFDTAVEAAKYGDYSFLEALGVDTRLLRYSELLKLAGEMAEYGDYSGLEVLGVDVSSTKEKEMLEKASAFAKYGDYTLLKQLYSGFSAQQSKISVTVQKGAESAYANGGYAQLVKYLDRQMSYGQINSEDKQRILLAITGG